MENAQGTYTCRTFYYADDWMDEEPGVGGSLEEVAQQLAGGVLFDSDSALELPADERYAVPPQPIPSAHDGFCAEYFYVPLLPDDGYALPDVLPAAPYAFAREEGGLWSGDDVVWGRVPAEVWLEGARGLGKIWLVCSDAYVTGTLHLSEGPIVTFEPDKDKDVFSACRAALDCDLTTAEGRATYTASLSVLDAQLSDHVAHPKIREVVRQLIGDSQLWLARHDAEAAQ